MVLAGFPVGWFCTLIFDGQSSGTASRLRRSPIRLQVSPISLSHIIYLRPKSTVACDSESRIAGRLSRAKWPRRKLYQSCDTQRLSEKSGPPRFLKGSAWARATEN